MKLGMYVAMLVTMIIFLEFVGVPTTASVVLTNFNISINSNTSQLISADIGNSQFWSKIFGVSGALIVIGGAALVIGIFARIYDPSLVILPVVTGTALLLISTFWSIIVYVKSLNQDWMTALIATIFIALSIGFVWSCIDYYAGR